VEPARLNYLDYVVPTYYTATTVRASSNLGSYDIIEKTDNPLTEYLTDIHYLIAILTGSPAFFIPTTMNDKGLSNLGR